MDPSSADDSTLATQLLRRLGEGDGHAADELLPLVYDELHRLARRHMARERVGHTLQTTALVNEAYLRLVGQPDPEWEGRSHFLAVASRAMRQVLVDNARARKAAKRGGEAVRLPLDKAFDLYEARVPDMLALDEALASLADLDEQLVRIVELRFFGGLSVPETGEVLAISPRSVKRGWSTARSWLHARLETP